MAEAAAKETQAPSSGPQKGGGKSNLILVVIAVLNMVAMVGMGYMLFSSKKKEAAEPKVEDVIRGEHEAQNHEKHGSEESFIGQIVPLETFIINLAGSKGRKIAKVSMEIELDTVKLASEIEKRKPQIRDIIINILSSKTFDEVSTKEGKDKLRNELKDTVNAFLTSGQIKSVYFTEFIYN